MVLGDGAFGMWLDYEGSASMNGIHALIKETPESPLIPSTMWGHSGKMAIYESRSGLSLDTKSASMAFSATRTVRNKPPIYGVLL